MRIRRLLMTALLLGAATTLVVAPALAQSKLGTPSFPGPSMSAHPLPIIQSQGLDKKNGWKHEWNVRTSAAAYLNDFYTNVYGALHVSGVNYIAKNYNKGTPIRIIGASLVFPYPVMVREGGGINSIADLKGKTMGVPKGSYIFAYLTAVLKHHGIDPEKDIKLQNVPIIQALQLFDRGDFDAVLVSPSPAVKLVDKAPGKYKVLFFPDDEVAKMLGVKNMYLIFVAHKDWLEANPGMSSKLLATMNDVQSFIDGNPAKAQEILAPKTQITSGMGSGGASMEPLMFAKMYRDGFFGRKMRWLGIPVKDVKEQLKKEFQLYKDVGMIDKIPDDGIFWSE